MNKLLISMTIAAVWMGSAAVLAQAPAATTTHVGKTAHAARRGAQLQGVVSAVDLTKNTVTITNRKNPAGTTVTLASDAKIFVTQAAAVGDLKVGDTIEAFGAVTPGATSISANRIAVQVVAARHRKAKANAGYNKNGVQGTIATTTPALTITTPGGVTVTVNTMAATQVSKIASGTTSDVTVGKTVRARTTGVAPSLTATEVTVLPARQKHHGRHHKNAAAA